MKKNTLFILFTFLMLSIFLLVGCGGGGASGGNVKEVEQVSQIIDAAYEKLDTLEYEKFTLTYNEESESQKRDIEIEFYANGYVRIKEYLKEYVGFAGAEPEEHTLECYVWVEDNTVTTTYYFKKGHNTPTKKYWVETFGSNEDALEDFYNYFDSYSEASTFLYPDLPIIFVANRNAEYLDLMKINVQGIIAGEKQWDYKISNLSENGFNITINREYEGGTDNYSMIVENGYVISYTGSDFMSMSFKLEQKCSNSKPDLSTYNRYN